MPAPAPYVITLSCGCRIRTRNHPLRPHNRYRCPYGLGHGYSVPWAVWTNGTRSQTNPKEQAHE